jgi:HEAT repeat protein
VIRSLPKVMAALLVAAALAAVAGCALDPIERLSEDIKSQDKAVRERAVLQLANIDDDRTTDLLADVLESDDELFNMAAVALVKKGREVKEPDPKKPNPVGDAVAKILANAHLAEPFRARASWTLGEISDRRAIPPLVAGLTAKTGDKDALLVQKMSKEALEKLGYYTDGRAFDLGVGTLEGQVSTLPEAPPLPA